MDMIFIKVNKGWLCTKWGPAKINLLVWCDVVWRGDIFIAAVPSLIEWGWTESNLFSK